MKKNKVLLLALLSSLLTACAGFFDKDNTPTPMALTQFSPEAKPHLLFSAKVGSGTSDEYLKLNPILVDNTIFAANANGTVASINKTNGHVNWLSQTKLTLNAGPGAGNGIVVVASPKGEIVALNQLTGQKLWQADIQSEVLAAPAISEHRIIIKTIDGSVMALSINDGRLLWHFQQVEPSLILRGASTPRISNGYALIGFANGHLVKLGLHNGQPYWERAISTPDGAFAISRMIDIDADPIISGHQVYAATYQGHIASLSFGSGDIFWSRDISSYTGMAANNDAVFVSDAKSHVWSFANHNGGLNWHQTQLTARIISAPATMGNYVVVGDAQGYLHWLKKQTGEFAAREFVGAAIYATPIVENGIVYVYTNHGNLLAYTLS